MSQNNPSIIYTGLDVHKATLQLHYQKKGEEIPNTKAGHARLLKVLQAAAQPVQLICEASGGYERPVLTALAAAGPGADPVAWSGALQPVGATPGGSGRARRRH